MRVYFDTEFSSLTDGAELISAGFVTEFGEEFYAELIQVNRSKCSDFVIETVIPLLDGNEGQRMSTNEFVIKTSDWLRSLDSEIILVSDSNWDYAVMCPVFKRIGGIEEAVPGVKCTLAPFLDAPARIRFEEGYNEYFLSNPGKQHHALHDAKALRQGLLRAEGFY